VKRKRTREQEPSQDEDVEEISFEEMTPTISCQALARISTPQTLKIEGYIKTKKVIVLIDYSSTHNFIHYKLAKALNCFIYPAPKFQVMIANGGTINCSGKFHKINITIGEYVMNSSMISIPMGGVDVVLGVQWLKSLGTVSFNFKEIFMKFSLEGKEFELKGITGKPSKVVSSNGMKKILKKENHGVIVQLFSLDVQTSKPYIPLDLQGIIDKHSKVFEYIRRGLPPTHDHDHVIHLIHGSAYPNIGPYRYPYAQKSEIEHMVEEMLEVGIIIPSQSSYSIPVVMVLKKEASWRMCPDYRDLNNITIKYKFPIIVIDEFLDELHGAIYFTKLGYDFEIIYKKGKKNVVADALSRKDEDVEAFLCFISIIQPNWIIEARDEWKNDEQVCTLIQRLQQDSSACNTFTWENDSLWYTDRLYLCKNSQLKQKVLLELHTSLVGGNSGFLKIYCMIKREFFGDGLKNDAQRFVE
jgi:hypothetical protein